MNSVGQLSVIVYTIVAKSFSANFSLSCLLRTLNGMTRDVQELANVSLIVRHFARVMLDKVMFQRVPTASDTHHHVTVAQQLNRTTPAVTSLNNKTTLRKFYLQRYDPSEMSMSLFYVTYNLTG